MRLEGQSKLGYFPTPPDVTQLVLTWLQLAEESGVCRLFDPCTGEGEALVTVATALAGTSKSKTNKIETYGVELSDSRAKIAATVLDHVLNTGFEYTLLTDAAFSLLWLNPPYDGQAITGGGTRLEETFLLNSTNLLAPGGLLVYIIPHSRISEKVARHLGGWYADLRCFLFPDQEYEVFNQCVILGRRRPDYTVTSSDTLHSVLAWADGKHIVGYQEIETKADEPPSLLSEGEAVPKKNKKERQPIYERLPELGKGHGEYAIPASPLRGKNGAAFRFKYTAVSDEDFIREAEKAIAEIEASWDWIDLIPPTTPRIITPVIKPKRGEIALQVNGGLLGTNIVMEGGQPRLLKGAIEKYSVTEEGEVIEDEVYDDKKKPLRKICVKERFSSTLAVLDPDGRFAVHRDPTVIGQLLERYVEQLAEIVMARNVPRYDLKPESWEWEVFNPLSPNRILPGMANPGLTDMQRQLGIANGRQLVEARVMIDQAEPGSGKTTIALGTVEYLYARWKQRQSRR